MWHVHRDSSSVSQQRSAGNLTIQKATLIRRQRLWWALKSTLELGPHEDSDPPTMTVIMSRVEAEDGRISSPTLRTGVSLSHNMTARGWRDTAGTVCRYKVILLLSFANLPSCVSYWVSAPVLCLGFSSICKAVGGASTTTCPLLSSGTCLSCVRLPLDGCCRSSCGI